MNSRACVRKMSKNPLFVAGTREKGRVLFFHYLTNIMHSYVLQISMQQKCTHISPENQLGPTVNFELRPTLVFKAQLGPFVECLACSCPNEMLHVKNHIFSCHKACCTCQSLAQKLFKITKCEFQCTRYRFVNKLSSSCGIS